MLASMLQNEEIVQEVIRLSLSLLAQIMDVFQELSLKKQGLQYDVSIALSAPWDDGTDAMHALTQY